MMPCYNFKPTSWSSCRLELGELVTNFLPFTSARPPTAFSRSCPSPSVDFGPDVDHETFYGVFHLGPPESEVRRHHPQQRVQRIIQRNLQPCHLRRCRTNVRFRTCSFQAFRIGAGTRKRSTRTLIGTLRNSVSISVTCSPTRWLLATWPAGVKSAPASLLGNIV